MKRNLFLVSKESSAALNIWLVTHIKPYFYPYTSYDGSNLIRLTWSANQVEDYTTQNFLEYHLYADCAKILIIRQSVSGILHTLLDVAVCCKVQVHKL